MSWLPWAIAAAALIALLVWKALAGRLSPEQIEEIRSALSKGARLVDVRTSQEFATGHVDGAVNIPLSELVNRTRELGKRNRTLVIYCRSGSRSGFAMRLLQQQGFRSVLDLKGMGNHGAVGLKPAR
jgi:phage shock protein E